MNKHRKSIRLKGYDYSKEGIYFVTICLQNRKCLFGHIDNEKIKLNDIGMMIKSQWLELLQQFNHIKLHNYTIMPNHFHAMIETVGVPLVGTQRHLNNKGQAQGIAPTLGDIVGAFKSITTNKYIDGVKNSNWEPFDKKLWQRNYWEHIIRDENEYNKISEYIINNPKKWEIDTLNPYLEDIKKLPLVDYLND